LNTFGATNRTRYRAGTGNPKGVMHTVDSPFSWEATPIYGEPKIG